MASTYFGNIYLSEPASAALVNSEWNNTPLTQAVQLQGDQRYVEYAQKITRSPGYNLLLDWQQTNCDFSGRNPDSDGLLDLLATRQDWPSNSKPTCFNSLGWNPSLVGFYESPYSPSQTIILPPQFVGPGAGIENASPHYPAPFEVPPPAPDVSTYKPQLVNQETGPGNSINPNYPATELFKAQPAPAPDAPNYGLYYDEPSSASQYGPPSPDLFSPISPIYSTPGITGQEEVLIDNAPVLGTPSPDAYKFDAFACCNSCDGNYIGLHSCVSNGSELLIACRFSECSSAFQTRNDFNHHYDSLHTQERPRPQVLIDCPVTGCSRIGIRGFKRKDNMLQHRRCVHGENIPKKYMRFGQAGSSHRKLRDIGKPGKRGKK